MTRLDELKSQLGEQFGSVKATRKPKNPYFAESADGKNQAFGKTKEEALENLITGIANRPHE